MALYWRKLPEPARKILWFVGLWAAGVVTIGAVAFLIRSILIP